MTIAAKTRLPPLRRLSLPEITTNAARPQQRPTIQAITKNRNQIPASGSGMKIPKGQQRRLNKIIRTDAAANLLALGSVLCVFAVFFTHIISAEYPM